MPERGYFNAATGEWVAAPSAESQVFNAAREALGPLAQNELLLRSQLTPELRVDLTALAEPLPPQPESLIGKIANWFMATVVKPEVEVVILGRRKSIAPWGKPEGNLASGIVIGGLFVLGAAGYAGYRYAARRRG